MDIENISMSIILQAGNAKKYLYEALKHARNAEFEQIETKMRLVSEELLKAHKLQTKLIQEDTKGELEDLPILLVHAQDHLMSVMSERSLVEEMIAMYSSQNKLRKKVNCLVEGMNVGKKVDS